MATTAAVPTSESLEQRLELAQAELEAAERELGAVAYEGGNVEPVQKRIRDAEDNVKTLRSAIIERDSPERKAERARMVREDARARWANVAWHIEQSKRVQALLKKRAEAEALEQHLMQLGAFPNEVDLDYALEAEQDRFPELKLPTDTCGGPYMRVAETAGMTLEQWAAEEKRLTPVATKLARLAKEAGADADPDTLPWNTRDQSTPTA